MNSDRLLTLSCVAYWTWSALGALTALWQQGGSLLALGTALVCGLLVWWLTLELLARFNRRSARIILYGLALVVLALVIFPVMLGARFGDTSQNIAAVLSCALMIAAYLLEVDDGPKKWVKKQLAALKPRLPRFARPVMGVPA